MLSHFLRAVPKGSFPILNGITTTAKSSSPSTISVNLPSGIVSGDGLIIILTAYQQPTFTTPSGWTLVATGVGASDSRAPRTSVFVKLATGSEGSTQSISISSPTESTAISARITNFFGVSSVQGSIVSTGLTSSPNPPSVTASWGSANNLWIALVGSRSGVTVSAYPTNYTLYQTQALNPSGNNRGLTFMAGRELATATEDPPAFTLNTADDTVAGTIVIRGT